MIVDSDPHTTPPEQKHYPGASTPQSTMKSFMRTGLYTHTLTYQHPMREFLSKVRLSDEEWNAIADDIVGERTVYDESK
jgi:hypothetical protein